MTFSFFLSVYSRCGAPASWAARHTTVCLDVTTLLGRILALYSKYLYCYVHSVTRTTSMQMASNSTEQELDPIVEVCNTYGCNNDYCNMTDCFNYN